jgi:hypothetical protein
MLSMPFDESYSAQFQALASALADGDSSESRRLVELVANPGALSPTTRLSSSLRRWAGVFARDSYTCRYCERQTIAPPVLRVVSHVFPTRFRFHPNWKTSETDAAYFVLSTSADHVVPVTRGGTDAPDNLVTGVLDVQRHEGKLPAVRASPLGAFGCGFDAVARAHRNILRLWLNRPPCRKTPTSADGWNR